MTKETINYTLSYGVLLASLESKEDKQSGGCENIIS